MKFPIPSFSHSGEDRLILKLFGYRTSGTYVDVGCYHPVNYSNTYLLYLMGWSGIVIDADDIFLQAYREVRPKDRVIHVGIAARDNRTEFYLFADRSLNTFDKARAQELQSQNPQAIVGKKHVEVRPLAAVLAEHQIGAVDFLNIDVEGLDLEVLMSNDWSRWRPKLVLVEDHSLNLMQPGDSAIFRYLCDQGYRLHSKCNYSSVYVCEDHAQNICAFEHVTLSPQM